MKVVWTITPLLPVVLLAACAGSADDRGPDLGSDGRLVWPDSSAGDSSLADDLGSSDAGILDGLAPDTLAPDTGLPVCPCFVKEAWCGTGVAKEAAKRGCQVPLLPAHNKDILYCPNGKWSVKQTCASGCVEAPAGTPDSCKTSAAYLAPFACGTTHMCTNGNFTSSHSGTDAYAYDFGMPVGTSLRAMRGGTVLRVRIVSTPGSACYNGGGSSCANYANTVEILHSDGTVGLYMHISSSLVSKGQSVKQGQAIAKSGNTGWSTGPHLHCQVQKNCGIWWCQSVAFKFGEKSTVSTGTYVTSQNC